MQTVCGGRVWEPWVADAIDEYLHHQGRAIDVGAFVGCHTLRMAKRSFSAVYAFEGQKSNAEQIRSNARRNNLHNNVRIVEETIDDGWKLSAELEEELLSEQKGPISLVKIDCEGCEFAFLTGARRVLEKWHPVIIVEIQDDESRMKVRKMGAGHGQQLVNPIASRGEILKYLREDLQYYVSTLNDEYGISTWDYNCYLVLINIPLVTYLHTCFMESEYVFLTSHWDAPSVKQ